MKNQILFFLVFFLIKISGSQAQNLISNGDFQNAYPSCSTASNLDPMYGISNACPVTFISIPPGGYEVSNYFVSNPNWSSQGGEPLMMWEGDNPITTPGGNTNYYIKMKIFSCYEGGSCGGSFAYNSITFSPLYIYTVTYQRRSLNVGINGGISFSLWNDFTSSTFQNLFGDKSNINSWQTSTFSFIPAQTYSKLLIGVGGNDDPQNEIDIDNIVITAKLISANDGCCDPSIAYTNNTNVNPLPSFSKAANYITATTNVKVMTGSNVTFQAGQYIQLNPGFETQSSTVFLASISPCITNAPVVSAGPDVSKQWSDPNHCAVIGITPEYGVNYSWTSTLPIPVETWPYGLVHPASYYSLVFNSYTIGNPTVCYPLYDGNGLMVTNTVTASSPCGTSGSDAMTYTYYLCYGCRTSEFGFPVEDNNNVEISDIYPNPTAGKLRLQIPANAASVNVIIDDLKGTRIYESNSISSQDIDLGNRESGIYILRTNIDGQIKNQKIVLNK